MFLTERCKLRPFEEKDLEAFMTYRNDDEWMKYQGFKNLTLDVYREKLLVPLNIESGVQLAIVDNTTDHLLGDLFLIKEDMKVSIGYTINPVYARKGYISELLNAILPVLKAYYPEYEINAFTDKDNHPSKNLLLKIGFLYDRWVEEWESEVYIFRENDSDKEVRFEALEELKSLLG